MWFFVLFDSLHFPVFSLTGSFILINQIVCTHVKIVIYCNIQNIEIHVKM